ncbi:MAG: Bug family tripartite tricarboxylate transporter substrate binding protein [Burkholderiales bacterium]
MTFATRFFVPALMLLSQVAPAAAQPYPHKPVRMVVPFAAGGSTDIMSRLSAQQMSQSDSFGQQVIVDNRPGVSGILGMDIVAKAQPDGYTVLVSSLAITVNGSLYAKLPFDPVKDFIPVTMVGSNANILVLHPSVPAKSLQEFIAYAKANPGKLNFGSGGPGSTPHLGGEQLKSVTGIPATHIPYKGGGQSVTALLGGEIQFIVESIPQLLPHVKAGKLRALGVTDLKRSPLLPELPTLDESGLKGYEMIGWNGMFVPAGTPSAIVNQLHAEVVKALAVPSVKERFSTMGADISGSSPKAFATFAGQERAKWAKVVKDGNIKVE